MRCDQWPGRYNSLVEGWLVMNTMSPEERLHELGHVLPPAPKSVANYVGSVQTGNLLFLSGKGPDLAGGRQWRGKLGAELTTEEGYTAARDTMLNLLAVVHEDIGALSRIRRIVKVLGMVNSARTLRISRRSSTALQTSWSRFSAIVAVMRAQRLAWRPCPAAFRSKSR